MIFLLKLCADQPIQQIAWSGDWPTLISQRVSVSIDMKGQISTSVSYGLSAAHQTVNQKHPKSLRFGCSHIVYPVVYIVTYTPPLKISTFCLGFLSSTDTNKSQNAAAKKKHSCRLRNRTEVSVKRGSLLTDSLNCPRKHKFIGRICRYI